MDLLGKFNYRAIESTEETERKQGRDYFVKKVLSVSSMLSVALWLNLPISLYAMPTKPSFIHRDLFVLQEDTLFLKQENKALTGTFLQVPSLHYAFGIFSLKPAAIAAARTLVTQEGVKIEYLLHDGNRVIGSANEREKFTFLEKAKTNDTQAVGYITHTIAPEKIEMIAFGKRIDSPRPPLFEKLWGKKSFLLEMKNGDRLPVSLRDEELLFTDGHTNFSIPTSAIVQLQANGGVHGTLKRENREEALPLCFAKDSHLKVGLANHSSLIKLPWEKIASFCSLQESAPPTETAQILEEWLSSLPKEKRWEKETPLLRTTVETTMAFIPSDTRYTAKRQVQKGKESLFPTANMPASVSVRPSFYADITPVTKQSYLQFAYVTGRSLPPHWKEEMTSKNWEKEAVVNIAYSDALAYAQWAGKRLLTEQEWDAIAKQFPHIIDEKYLEWTSTSQPVTRAYPPPYAPPMLRTTTYQIAKQKKKEGSAAQRILLRQEDKTPRLTFRCACDA